MSRITTFIRLAFGLCLTLSLAACLPGNDRQGIHVYFESSPNIYQSDVYWFGKVVGKITDHQVGRGSVARLTIQIDPQFKERVGSHWAFYVDQGRLTAGQLSLSGDAVGAGDSICGFNSKASFNWFKFKTLLNDRVGRAMNMADQLHLRFCE